MFRLLLKRSFKTIFRNKLFVILMSLLVFVTSLTFTIFESAASSFKTSYNQVVNQGALHDLVIKENFQIPNDEKIDVKKDFKIDDKNGQELDVDEANITKVFDAKSPLLTFVVKKDFSKYSYYADPKSPNLQVQIDISTWADRDKVGYKTSDELISDYLKQAKSQFETNFKAQIAQTYISNLSDLYKDEISLNEMNALSVSSDVSAFKVVKYNTDTEVNRMYIYDGADNFTKALTDQEMLDNINKQIDIKEKSGSNITFSPANVSKGYKITAQDNGSQVVSVVDVSAYQAIISPTYANANHKSSISLNDFINLSQKVYPQADGSIYNFFDELANDKKFQSAFADNLMWVDKTPYFIIGIGQTPDFVYPIIDEKHPTIDKQNQAIVYVNPRGYQRIVDGFRTNPTENYISLRFHNNVSTSRRNMIMDEIEQRSQNASGVPKNSFGPEIKMVTHFDDPNDQMTLTQERVGFLTKLQKAIATVSYLATSMLVVLVAIIVAMVFGVLISSNRKSLATLLALGYSKTKIALSTACIALLIGGIPAVIGYLVGFATQYGIINAFSDFWTIPTYGHTFSYISVVVTLILPTIPLFVLIALVTYWTLNYSIPSMLKDATTDNSWIVAKIMSPFKMLGIKTKYSLALVLRNSGKVVLVSITTIIAAVSLMVGVSTIGRGEQAYLSTIAQNNYEYKTDLYSPTVEGGQYNQIIYNDDKNTYRTTINNFPDIYSNDNIYSSLADEPKNEQIRESQPYWHIPSINSSYEKVIAQAEVPTSGTTPSTTEVQAIAHYLKNKIQTKALLDKTISGIDPWSTAKQLMPDNQINTANQNYSDIEALAAKYDDLKSADFFKIIQDPRIAEKIKPYLITYDVVPTNTSDELYTYIDSSLSLGGNLIRMNVAGVSSKTKMINISADNKQKLANAWKSRTADDIVPILINRYSSEIYNLKAGSLISAVVNNDADRNFKGHTVHNIKYRVVGITNSYDDSDFVTLKDAADITVMHGHDADFKNNKSQNSNNIFFNGVFSTDKNPVLLANLPLYSPSGFYFASDTVAATGSNFSYWLNQALQNQSVWKYGNAITNDPNEFVAKYSSTPLSAIVSKVDWKEMNAKTFSSINKFSTTLISIIEGVSIVISILFTFIVIGMIIRTNRKRIATLWTIGYRKSEITRIFSSNVIVPIILAAIIAPPISMGLTMLLRSFVAHIGHVLIPFSLAIWIPFVVLGGIAIIYVLSTAIFIKRLSSSNALEAFKGD